MIRVLIALVLTGILLISAGSAGSNNITLSTGEMLVTPWSTTISPLYGDPGGNNRYNELWAFEGVSKSSQYLYSGTASEIWGGFQGPSPIDKSIKWWGSFDLPDNQTSQSDNANSQPIPPSPTPTITPDFTATTFYWNPYTPLKLSNYFQAGYMPLVPHTNPALYYPETSSAGGIAYESNFTDNQG